MAGEHECDNCSGPVDSVPYYDNKEDDLYLCGECGDEGIKCSLCDTTYYSDSHMRLKDCGKCARDNVCEECSYHCEMCDETVLCMECLPTLYGMRFWIFEDEACWACEECFSMQCAEAYDTGKCSKCKKKDVFVPHVYEKKDRLCFSCQEKEWPKVKIKELEAQLHVSRRLLQISNKRLENFMAPAFKRVTVERLPKGKDSRPSKRRRVSFSL